MSVQLIDFKAKNLNSDLIRTTLSEQPKGALINVDLSAAHFALNQNENALSTLFTLLLDYRVETLDLSITQLSQPEFFAEFIKFIKKNPEVNYLNLSHNKITNSLFSQLLTALQDNSHIQHISFQGNLLDENIISALNAERLQHPALKTFDFTDNKLSEQDLLLAQIATKKLTLSKTKLLKTLFYQPNNLPLFPTVLHNLILNLMEPSSYNQSSTAPTIK